MFENKVAVVTGGAKGIGRAIAGEFGRAGTSVCVIDRLENDYYVGELADQAVLEDFACQVMKPERVQIGGIPALLYGAPAERGEIAASSGQTLYWEYLCWVREHPVHSWTCPVRILYGSGDNMTPRRTVEEYVRRHDARLTVVEGGEHWFHTPEQLSALREWEERES